MSGIVVLTLLMTLGACSLFHQDLPNEAPILSSTQADTLRVKRDGSVTLNVLASDEDDDVLDYVWEATGGTLEPSGSRAEWIAPGHIEGTSQIFTVRVTVFDRQCDLIAEPQDRHNCETTALASTDSFRIEVVQNPPTLSSIAFDEAPSFRSPMMTVSASASDQDGDLLAFEWSAEDTTLTALIDSVGPEVDFIPLFPGVHVIRVTVHDRADSVVNIIILDVPSPADVPDGGTVRLELPESDDMPARAFEIDVFEYPNQRGQVPMLVDSFFEAEQICSDLGARLCTNEEWALACAGQESGEFSSVDDPGALPARFGRRFCNTTGSAVNPVAASTGQDSAGVLAESGSFPNCSSLTGVYDLTGNAREWLEERGDSTLQVGMRSSSSATAKDATCQEFEVLPAVSQIQDESDVRYFESGSGFRCCRDLEVVDAGKLRNKVGGDMVDDIVGDIGQ